MSYVDDHLLPGERVVYRAYLHWAAFGWSIVLAVLAIAALVVTRLLDADPNVQLWVPVALGALALFSAIGPYIKRASSEFAVTDKRVIAKVGVVQRDSLETMLSKIEAIGVDQTLMGRLFGYGAITIVGTGGTKEAFDRIAAPLEFRRQVQTQIAAAEDRRAAGGSGGADPALSRPDRQERECPYCAEMILARAQVCRFCDRAVQPTA